MVINQYTTKALDIRGGVLAEPKRRQFYSTGLNTVQCSSSIVDIANNPGV